MLLIETFISTEVLENSLTIGVGNDDANALSNDCYRGIGNKKWIMKTKEDHKTSEIFTGKFLNIVKLRGYVVQKLSQM
jgi:hypothetical protein